MARGAKPGHAKAGGRQIGTPNKASAEIRDLVREYCPAAVIELARLAQYAVSEQARVAAIKELFDRGYGKATETIRQEFAFENMPERELLLVIERNLPRVREVAELPLQIEDTAESTESKCE